MARKKRRQEKVLLSACLAGVHCVWDGTDKYHPVFAAMDKEKMAVLFCPEALGGLKPPHPPSEIKGGDGFDVLRAHARVVSREGQDVTAFFVKGARASLEKAKKYGLSRAILKSRSPSCGCGQIYDGTFSKKLISGYGVTAALLKNSGIGVTSDEEYLEEMSPGVHHVTRHQKKPKSILD